MRDGNVAASSALVFRPARLEDKQAILQLLERATGTRRDPEQWDWLFIRNTSSSNLHWRVAETDGRIVAQSAMLPVRLTHAGKDLPGLVECHVATDPAFQGRGILAALDHDSYAAVAADRAVVFGFPNPASAPTYYGKLSWVELRPFPAFVRPLGNIGSAVAEQWPRLAPLARLADAFAPAGLLPAWVEQRLAERTGARVVRIEHFGVWADRLWEELRPCLGTAAIRDALFLSWRFCASPFAYTIYGLDRGSGPIGFAVLRIRPGKFADLMELMVPPQDRSGAALLLAHAVRDAWSREAVALRAIVSPRHPHRAAFRRAGFLRMPARLKAGYSFGVCVLDQSRVVPNALLHIDDWYISGADLDFI